MNDIECAVEGCSKVGPNAGRGMCYKHYHRFRKYGDPTFDSRSPELRFWPKVSKSDGCWDWTGATIRGYGAFRYQGKVAYAHRVAYELLAGPIPDGLTIDHLCRNPLCVRPDHLEPVTQGENTRRAVQVGYHANSPRGCRRGHDWAADPPLLAHRSDGSITRTCRVCVDERGAA